VWTVLIVPRILVGPGCGKPCLGCESCRAVVAAAAVEEEESRRVAARNAAYERQRRLETLRNEAEAEGFK
jgi:hypothetical protein